MSAESSRLSFVKAAACGNDFLVAHAHPAIADLASVSRFLCDRQNGVGADGVEWLFPTDQADVQARLFNADGSEAEISGNGTRCVAAYLLSQRSQNGPGADLTILTGAGVKRCSFTGAKGSQLQFEMDMGAPTLGDELTLSGAGREINGRRVSMGNPHFVVFVSGFVEGWQDTASALQKNQAFPHGTNIEFVRISDRNSIDVRFFERGVGQTRSSGTGSCAAAVASVAAGLVESPVQVNAEGGVQTVRWEGSVYLTGTARLIFEGAIELV